MTLTKKNLNQNCHGPVITFFSCILKMCISYNRRDRLLIKMHIPLCLMIYIFYQKNIYYFFIFILLKNLSSEQTWCSQQANKLCLGSGSCFSRIRLVYGPRNRIRNGRIRKRGDWDTKNPKNQQKKHDDMNLNMKILS